MIIREILRDDFSYDSFDYFNDIKDTCQWLRSYIIGERHELGEPLNQEELEVDTWDKKSLVFLRDLALEYKKKKK